MCTTKEKYSKLITQFGKSQKESGLKDRTVKIYLDILFTFFLWLESKYIEVDQVTTNTSTEFILHLKSNKHGISTLNTKLRVVRRWYDFIIDRKLIKKNPFIDTNIRGTHRKIVKDILPIERLEEIFNFYVSTGVIHQRNKCLLSLVVYQGLTLGELSRLTLTSISLIDEVVKVESTKRSKGRELELNKAQRILFQEYLNQTRPVLLKMRKQKESDMLFLSAGKGDLLSNSVSYLIKGLQKEFPDLKNLKQIRASVITNWVNTEKNIVDVKEKTGFRYLSSVEAYDHKQLDELKKKLDEIINLNFF